MRASGRIRAAFPGMELATPTGMTTWRDIAALAFSLVVVIGITTAGSGADMVDALPPVSRFELARPDFEPLRPPRWEPPHADLDTWTPARFQWSRPDFDTSPPADLPLSHPDVEQ